MSTTTSRIPQARRTAWMTARARNAARRGGLVAGIGLLAVVVTLLVLVLVPREVNRTVRARVAALPAPADTVPLLANLTGAMDRLRNAESNLQTLRDEYADRVANATGNTNTNADAPSSQVTASGELAEQSDARRDLLLRVARARSAPLVENFRAIGDAEFLRNDASIQVVLDSLNDVNRDREAYAALGGPDARYAAMSARLAALGQRLVRLAEQRLATTQSRAVDEDVAATAVSTADTPAPGSNTAMLAQAAPYLADSTLDLAARQAHDSAKVQLQAAEQLLRAARETNASIAAERERVQADAPAQVPPVAMLVAALVIGVAIGYGVAFYREVAHPRVADAAEAERVTDSRVIVHSRPSGAAVKMRHRRQSDAGVAPVVDSASESFLMLHVTLTGFGDTSRHVEVVSQDALLGATVAINLAAAAARDSRSTLLVDTDGPASPVARMFAAPGKKAIAVSTSLGDTANSIRQLVEPQRVGRDLFIGTISVDAPGALPVAVTALALEHDFTVVVRTDTTGDVRDATGITRGAEATEATGRLQRLQRLQRHDARQRRQGGQRLTSCCARAREKRVCVGLPGRWKRRGSRINACALCCSGQRARPASHDARIVAYQRARCGSPVVDALYLAACGLTRCSISSADTCCGSESGPLPVCSPGRYCCCCSNGGQPPHFFGTLPFSCWPGAS